MKKIVLFCAVGIGIALATASAQDAAVKKLIELGKTDNQVMNHLDVLTNRFGGRPIGSDAYDNAVDWVASKFAEWGLEVELNEGGTLPVGFNRGPWFGRMLGGDQAMMLHFVTPSYSSGTKGLQRGHVLLEPKTREDFDRMKHALKGAWVLVTGKSTGWAITHGATADSARASNVARNVEIRRRNQEIAENNRLKNRNDTLLTLLDEPALFYREMREAGMLGIIQSAPVPLVALYDRSVVKDSTMTFDRLPEIPDIKLDEHQYEIIRQMVLERRVFELEFDIRNHFKIGPVKYYSVAGKIRGSDYPDEYVILSGHLDSHDAATGGVDCGSGVTSVIEAARLVAKSGARPKRSMLFIAFAGEEYGLLGAQAWAASHPEQWDKISNVFNRDGGPLPPVSISVPKAMYADFVQICAPLSSIHPEIPFQVKETGPGKKPVRLSGTDASVFAIKGIPAIALNEEDIKGYNFNYREIWHTERDLYTKSIPEYQQHAATVMAIVGLGVANLDHLLSRKGLYE
ncbi:MAG: M28 family peptidase [Tannerella sp.]|nr:M28 family peptidase [Tannerella sp.]